MSVVVSRPSSPLVPAQVSASTVAVTEVTPDVIFVGTNDAPAMTLPSPSPPEADKPTTMQRSLTVDGDFFERRELRLVCTQRAALSEQFHPQATEILPRLYLSDLYTATSPKMLEVLGITHVVTVIREPCYRYPRAIKHLIVPVDDTKSANILAYFAPTISWMHHALTRSEHARVLVHCVWGMSRSATLIIAYLIAMQKMSLEMALSLVRMKRNVVRPNAAFMVQLRVWEMEMEERERRKWMSAQRRKAAEAQAQAPRRGIREIQVIRV